jgi:hypothetical protein
MANASALELATALVDEDNIEELEPILQDSLDEINGKKEFLCPECNKKYKTERGRNRHVLINTRLLKVPCRKMIYDRS